MCQITWYQFDKKILIVSSQSVLMIWSYYVYVLINFFFVYRKIELNYTSKIMSQQTLRT